MEAFRYKAFLSYSWKDRQAVEALHRALETYRPPGLAAGAPAPLRPIFRDRDEEAAGASLRDIIEDALDASEFLVIACSPNSAASKWVNKEIAYFRKRRTPDNILCYVISGDPGVDALPPALLRETTIDGELLDVAIEAPLAADARKEGDGPRFARLKIAAALLGARLDDLVRRDEARRVRRLRMLLAGASAMVVSFAGIAAFAVYQRNIAVENEARAKREALKASRTADFMVGLFSVPDPSQSRGEQVTAREILDKGVASIERDLIDEPDVQANLMTTMGRSYTGLGLYPDAARILSVARGKRVETESDPADLYATENALARAEFEKGDLDAAHNVYSKLVAEAQADIAKGGWRTDYAEAFIGMGETTLYRDDAAAAQKFYERARGLLEAHGGGETETMARALRGMANAREEQGDFNAARAFLLEALSQDRKNSTLSRPLIGAILSDEAHVEYRMRNLDAAIAREIEVVKLYRTLLGPKHPDFLVTVNNLARYEFESGKLMSAYSRLKDTVRQESELIEHLGADYAYFLNTLGEIEWSFERNQSALEYFSRAKATSVSAEHRLFPVIVMNIGVIECQNGNMKIGEKDVAGGRDMLAAHYGSSDWRYGVADEFESRCAAAGGNMGQASKKAKEAVTVLLRELGPEHYFTKRAIKWRDGLKDG